MKSNTYWSGVDGPSPNSEFSAGISMLLGFALIVCRHVQMIVSNARPAAIQKSAANVIMQIHTARSSRREYPFPLISHLRAGVWVCPSILVKQ